MSTALAPPPSAEPVARLALGTYPTPVERLAIEGASIWAKRDDLTEPHYGGNKVRKLERILADARARGATRLVTVGAAGSHHVLATTYFGARAGFDVEAVLVPQARSAHVVESLRASVAQGARVLPARTYVGAAWLVARRRLAGSYYVPLGGSSLAGSMAYVDAAGELASQVRAGALPEPDWVVVAAGSGGTAAGLAAGLEREGLRTRVAAVVVATPSWAVAWLAKRMARACARRAGVDAAGAASRLAIDRRWVGAGYGIATPEGTRATEIAASVGVSLDATYTSKAFAAALDLARSSRVVFWNTLSSAPMAPLLADAPDEAALDARVRRLLR